MDKTAQKRSLLNRLQEMANVPARSAEEFFKPELKKVMNVLIDADDVVRSTLSGQKIGKASPEDPVSAKDLLKEAKSFINRREYLSAVASLGRFHKKMSDVASVLKSLDLNVNSIHHRFLFEKLPGKHKEQLEGMRSRFAADQSEYFIKEANIMDFFHNIGTQRGRALAAWEKRYPKVVGKIREGALAQLESSQSVLESALATLKEMGSSRASRNIDAYLDSGKELVNAINKYDSGKGGFRSYYNDVIRPYLDTQAKLEVEQAATPAVTPEEGAKMPSSVPEKEMPAVGGPAIELATIPPSPGTPAMPPQPPGVGAPPSQPSSSGPDTEPSPPPTMTPEPELKSEQVHQEIMDEIKKRQAKTDHQLFLESLAVFGNEDPALLSAHITKYARSIQVDDVETAIKLFQIAKSLRG